ncbi:hypothetical protein Ciccas_005350 [Cichlidogyrus casuarinus]|uniref:Uncharacterized protein n=1 Tax=Cichlidogyrus casuarinus TaxID=1844966 RepID=A0ABD2Q8Z3_9PLAT
MNAKSDKKDEIAKLKYDEIIQTFDITKFIQDNKQKLPESEDLQPEICKTEYLEIYVRKCVVCGEENKFECLTYHIDPNDIIFPGTLSVISTMDIIHILRNNSQYNFVMELNTFRTLEILDDRNVVAAYSGGKITALAMEILPQNLDIESFKTPKKNEVKDEELPHSRECSLLMTVSISPNGHICKYFLERLNDKDQMQDWDGMHAKEDIIHVERIITETKMSNIYKYEVGQSRATITEDMANLSTVLREVVKTDGHKMKLVLSSCVLLRTVKQTVKSKSGKSKEITFCEPVYCCLSPKQKKMPSSRSDIRNSLVHEKENSEGADSLKECDTIEGKTSDGKYTHFRIYQLDKFMGIDTILSNCIRNDDSLKEVLHRNVAEMQFNKFLKTPQNIGVIKEKKPRFLLNMKVPKGNKQVFSKMQDLKDDGIRCSYKLIKKVDDEVLEEEIIEPSPKAIISWILQLPKAKDYTGNELLMQIRCSSFYLVRTLNFDVHNTAEESPFNLPPQRSVLIRVHCKQVEKFADNYDSVSDLKKTIPTLDHFHSLYYVENKSHIIYNHHTNISHELRHMYETFQSTGKDVIKFCVFDQSQQIGELEIKTELVDKVGFGGIIERKRKFNKNLMNLIVHHNPLDSKYTDNYEAEPKCIVSEVRESLLTKMTTKVLLAQDGRNGLVVKITEPNIQTILAHRALTMEPQQERYFGKLWEQSAHLKVTPDELKSHFKLAHSLRDNISKNSKLVLKKLGRLQEHQKDCPFALLGNFAIKVDVEIFEIRNEYGLDPDGNLKQLGSCCIKINQRSEIKLVQCLCLECPSGKDTLLNSDILSEAAYFSLPSQIVSPLDIFEAISNMLNDCARVSEKDWPKLLKRFKHRLQRCMAHDTKRLH